MTDLTPEEKARIESNTRAYREREMTNHRYGVIGHCIACGGRHEDAKDLIACLERHLIAAQNAHAPCLKLRAEVAALKPSNVKARGR